MTILLGTWALSMRTPIGSIHAEYTFTDAGGTLTGTAVGASETVELRNLRSIPAGDGEEVTWQQSITKPLRLNLDFDVLVIGDTMTGHSRAGRLPRSTVSGSRLTPDASTRG